MISPKEQKDLAIEIKTMALIFSHDITKEVIAAYVRILAKHDFKKAKASIAWALENCKFFPKPAELLERINPKPQREDADAIAGRAIDAIYKFGWNNSLEAKLYIGHEGWKAVSRIGGWRTLCDTREDQLGMLRAQLRDQCFSVMNHGEVSRREAARMEINLKKQMLEIGDTMKKEMKEVGISDPDFMNDSYAVKLRKFEQEKEKQLAEIRKIDFTKNINPNTRHGDN